MRSQFARKKVATGLSAFDQITGGGLPRSSTIVLSGEAGSGKKLLARHLMWNLLQHDAKILYFSIDQSAEELQYYMHNYGWDIAPFEANGHLKIVDVFSNALEKFQESANVEEPITFDLENLSQMQYHKSLYDLEMLTKEGAKFFTLRSILANRKQFRLVIFDSISPLLLTNDKSVFRMIHTLKLATRMTKASGIAILNSEVHDNATIGMMKSLADAIIELRNIEKGVFSSLTLQRYVGVKKLTSYPIEQTARGTNIIPLAMPELENNYIKG